MSAPLEDPRAGRASTVSLKRLPRARARTNRWSGYYLLPLAALGLVVYLAYAFLSEQGPLISIRFATAEGLSDKRTAVKHRAVTLGTVEKVELGDDLSHVLAHVRMSADAEGLLTEHTRFWVVRPRLGAGMAAFQTGLETLVSGAYVALDPGPEGGKPQRDFVGLDEPPAVRSDEPGRTFFLLGEELGGLTEGAPVFFREAEVGEVVTYDLGSEGSVRVRVFVRAPYDERVVTETRFWNVSALSLESGVDGLRVELKSLRALLSGGIAFGNPQGTTASAPSAPESVFRLHSSRAEAEIGSYGRQTPFVSYFDGSLQGLNVGSEVRLLGQRVGSVTAIALAADPRTGREERLAARVSYVVEADRASGEASWNALGHEGVRRLKSWQLRAVLGAPSFLTGVRVVSLEYRRAQTPDPPTAEGNALVLPGEVRGLEETLASVSAIAARLDVIPFEEIGHKLDSTLHSIGQVVDGPELRQTVLSLSRVMAELSDLSRRANAGLGPALDRLPEMASRLEQTMQKAEATFGRGGYGNGSTLQKNLEAMTDQVGDAARSVRLLADFLQRHPEALVRGRSSESP